MTTIQTQIVMATVFPTANKIAMVTEFQITLIPITAMEQLKTETTELTAVLEQMGLTAKMALTTTPMETTIMVA